MPVANISGVSVLFIHIPKCAGMSISRLLADAGTVVSDRYLDAYGRRIRLRHLHREPLQQLYTEASFDWVFAIVRHPEERMKSEYRYQRRKSGFHLQNVMPFQKWLRYSLWRAALSASYRENHFRPQTDFLAFNPEIFRLDDGLEAFQERFRVVTGYSAGGFLNHDNRSPKEEILVTDADRALIRKHYAADYRAFGFK